MTKVTKTTMQHIPARFGRFGSGDETCAIGVRIDREKLLNIGGGEGAYEHFAHIVCGTRCDVELRVDPNGAQDAPGQGKLLDNGQLVFKGEAVIPSGSIGRRAFGCTLQFNLDGTDHETLLKMSCREGTLTLKRRGEMPDKRRGDSGEDVDGQQEFGDDEEQEG